MRVEPYDMRNLLERKKSLILQGRPGMGKAYCAKRLAWAVKGEAGNSRIAFVQFHQSTTHDGFVRGHKPPLRNVGKLNPSARVVPRATEGEVPSFLPQLGTDVTLRGPSSTLIIDCKCYGKILGTHHGKKIAKASHINQMFAYVLHEANAVKGLVGHAAIRSCGSRCREDHRVA